MQLRCGRPQSQPDSSSRTEPCTQTREHPASLVQGATGEQQGGLCGHQDPQKERLSAGLYLPQHRHRALPSSCRRSLAPSAQAELCVQWEMSQGKDISYLCIFVWHEELFTKGPAPSTATFLPAAPALVLTQSQRRGPSSSHGAFGKLWKCRTAHGFTSTPFFPLPSEKEKSIGSFLLKMGFF